MSIMRKGETGQNDWKRPCIKRLSEVMKFTNLYPTDLETQSVSVMAALLNESHAECMDALWSFWTPEERARNEIKPSIADGGRIPGNNSVPFDFFPRKEAQDVQAE